MYLGIGSYTFGWASGAYGFSDPSVPTLASPMTAKELVEKALELRVPSVQICYRPALHEFSETELDDLSRYASARGVIVEIGTSGSEPELLGLYAEIASKLRAPLVRTIMPGASPDLKEERRILATILPQYERAGVVLAIETHEDYSVHALQSVIQEADSPWLKVCIDPINSLGRAEGTDEVISALMPHVATLHMKDFNTKRRPSGMGFEITGDTLGRGRLNVPRLLEEAQLAGFSGSVVLEQWSDYKGSLDASIADQEETAAEGISYLKSVGSKFFSERPGR